MSSICPRIHVIAVMIGVCLAFSAHAGVEATRPDARLVIAGETLPGALESGEWSLMVWVYAPQEVRELSSLVSIGGRLDVYADAGGVYVAGRHEGRGAPLRLASPLQAGRWHLLAVSMDAPGDRVQAWLATQGEQGQSPPIATASSRMELLGTRRSLMGAPLPAGPSGRQPALSKRSIPRVDPVLSPDRTGLVIGADASGTPAAMLVYEALVIRDHSLNDTDVQGVWDSRWFYAPHSLETVAGGGRMNGWRGCEFLTFHAMSPLPSGTGIVREAISYVGGPVLTTNLMMVRTKRELSEVSAAFTTVGPVASVRGMVYRSRIEPEFEGFFEIEPVSFEAPNVPVGTIGPKASMLARGPQGLVRVMVSANSRGTRGTIFPQPWPENFAHGFVQALLPHMAGVLMRPSTILDEQGGWFGFDTTLTFPDNLLIRRLHSRTDGWGDFTRFGSGTLPGVSRGPGPATSISPGGEFHLRCGPVPGSLLRSDAPLVVRSTLLAFPGSSELIWYPERGAWQDGEGLALGDPERLGLDTTRVIRQLGGEDVFASETEIVFAGSLDVRVDDAIVVTTGPDRGAVSVVVGVDAGSSTTTVRLSHPFGSRPAPGASLHIGPWRFVSVENRFEAVPDGDDRTWRGQVLRSAADAGIGVMVYGVSAWRPDVNGFVIGAAGQGGRGYTPQLDNSFPGATAAWARESQADVWIQGLAGQDSQPESMLDYLDALREGLGYDAEILWATDAVHAHSTHQRWHEFVRDNAVSAGVPAIFAVDDPRIGAYLEQAASGMRTDGAHFTSFGNKVIAEAWLEQIRILASGPCAIADYDQDGQVTVFDLLVFQTDWEARSPRADLDGDGLFLIFDFLFLLNAIDDCG